MSSIGPSGFPSTAPINPYAGNLRSTSDAESARTKSADQTAQADHRQMNDAVMETTEPEGSSDRDADGTGGFSRRQSTPGEATDSTATEHPPDHGAQGAPSRPILTTSPGSHIPDDDRHGQLLDTEV